MKVKCHQEARPPISLDQTWGSCGVWSGMDCSPFRDRLTEVFRKPTAVNFRLVVLRIHVDEEASMLLAEELLLCATSAIYE